MKRDWQPDESFTFQIAAGDSNPEAPMPKQRTVTVTNPGGADAYQNGQRIPFAFGAITYTKPGTYQYVITEQGGGKPGMQYSGARYIATVTVTDNGDGTMSAAAVLTNTFGDDGVHIDGEPEAASADFTNTFVGENESVATIRGIKHYTDHTGSKPNNVVGTFNVMITPDEGNPANGPTFKSDVPVGVDGTWTRKLQFTNEALNGQHEQTFTYHVREIVPEGVGSGNPTKDGMTYDVNTYDVQITVSRDEQHNLITTVTYPDGGERVELTNSYRAQNTDAQALGVTKAVTGRDAEAGKFTFDATLRTNNAQYVKVEQPDGTLKDWATASVPTPAITKGKSADIDFGSLVFTMPGTYTFAVREQLPDGASAANPKVDGWTYDTHAHRDLHGDRQQRQAQDRGDHGRQRDLHQRLHRAGELWCGRRDAHRQDAHRPRDERAGVQLRDHAHRRRTDAQRRAERDDREPVLCSQWAGARVACARHIARRSHVHAGRRWQDVRLHDSRSAAGRCVEGQSDEERRDL